MSKNKIYPLLIVFLLCICTSSCTYLQWRMTEEEIQEKFKKVDIKTSVSYVRIDSLDLDVRVQEVASKGDKINLVFFHGSPSSLSAWDGYFLNDSLRAVANLYGVDRPGYGYSNFGEEIPSIETQAQLMNTVINYKKLDNVIAIGASYGGPIAARLAYFNDKVKAAVMISPAIDPTIEKDIWASRFTQWKATRWMVPTAYRVAGDEKKIHANELALIENYWKDISVPVVHIHGDDDDLVPYENIHFSKKNFQDIKIITIPEKGHEISWKHPELIIPHLMELMETLQKKE